MHNYNIFSFTFKTNNLFLIISFLFFKKTNSNKIIKKFNKKEKGRVYSFGDNYFGQLGIGNTNNQSNPQLMMNDQSIFSISCSAANTFIFLKKKGDEITILGTGKGYLVGGTEKTKPTIILKDVKDIQTISFGAYHAMFKKSKKKQKKNKQIINYNYFFFFFIIFLRSILFNIFFLRFKS